MFFALGSDVIIHLHRAGLPYKHFEVEGRWSDGLDRTPTFLVGLGEFSAYEDIARSLRLRAPIDAEAAARAWFERQLNGTNARFVGRLPAR